MGIRSSSTVSLTFEDCEVPGVGACWGSSGTGSGVALAALDGGRIGIASQATGTIRAALDASARYARERKAFGKPIAGVPGHRLRARRHARPRTTRPGS